MPNYDMYLSPIFDQVNDLYGDSGYNQDCDNATECAPMELNINHEAIPANNVNDEQLLE
jgi:hypothetical protein